MKKKSSNDIMTFCEKDLNFRFVFHFSGLAVLLSFLLWIYVSYFITFSQVMILLAISNQKSSLLYWIEFINFEIVWTCIYMKSTQFIPFDVLKVQIQFIFFRFIIFSLAKRMRVLMALLVFTFGDLKSFIAFCFS